ncbi:MAG: 2-isopropylmalate synthase [Thiotrichaceae bacterium]|nr:2-isopropylmalate synthase [Thiotrichaceae bacterium]
MTKPSLIIFDTTLRDGEQSPGASMTLEEKVRIAKVLELLRVDVIEAGFPIASSGDFDAVKAVADTIKDATVCGLSRALDKDIEAAGAALKNAVSPRIHTFIATSPIHMREKLNMSPDQVVEYAVKAIKKARQYTDDVEFSAEDAGRSQPDFLKRIVEAAIKAGASTINIPDTVGYTVPHEFGMIIKNLIESVPNSDKAIFSVHCHNDLGLAVGNSLSAFLNGARQIECTVNGLGERAGNASLEEIVMAVRTRQDIFPCDSRIDSSQIVPASRLVSRITGFPVQPNKAIVGKNAFAHESGIHQDGVLKNRETYEIMRAQDVGWSDNQIVLGKLSGRNAFSTRLSELGHEFTSVHELNQAFQKFKNLADRKHAIFDEDILLIALQGQAVVNEETYELVFSNVCSETGETPNAQVTLRINDEEHSGTAIGGGPVDAVFKAIESIIQSKTDLKLYSVSNITSGTDSQGEVTVQLEKNNTNIYGYGAHTDIVIASARAYIDALNKLAIPAKAHPQHGV